MILFVINEKETEMDGNIICNVYAGEFSVTKTGTVSGNYRKANLTDFDELDCNEKNIAWYQMGQNVVAIRMDELLRFQSDNIIVGYESNRKIVVVSKMLKISLKNVSLDKNRLFLIEKNDVIKVEEKNHVFVCGLYTICLIKKSLYIIDGIINKKVLKQVIFSRRPKNEIGMDDLFVRCETACEYHTCEETSIQVSLVQKKNALIATPQVLYFGRYAKINSEKSVILDGNIYYRDYVLERKLQTFFDEFDNISTNYYSIPISIAYSVVKKMIENGFEVILDKKKVNLYDDAFRQVRVKSGIDWFEMGGSIQFDEDSIQISDLIGNNNFWVEGQDRVLLLPENISNVLDIADKDGRIEKTPENYSVLVENSENGLFDVRNLKHLFDEDIVLKLPENMFSILYDYQFDGIVWMKSLIMHNYGGCLADDMGLGKTLQILSLIADEDVRKKYPRVLVIVPRTLMGNWISEYEKFYKGAYSVDIYYGGNRELRPEVNVYITTYGMVVSDFERFVDFSFDLIVIDEAQKIKNFKSKTRRVIKRLCVGKTAIIATGTPYENNMNELWSLMDIANPGILGRAKQFSEKYVTSVDEHVVMELGYKLSPFLLRRTKEMVLQELPEKLVENIYCLMDTKQQKLYNAMLLKIKKNVKSVKELDSRKLQMLNGLTFLREICCHPKLINEEQYSKCNESVKLDIICEIVNECVDEKIVIFSQFTKFLKCIADRLEEANIQYCYIDGQTNNRQKEIEEFNESEKKVFLISLKAGGFGLNLTNAKKMIIADPWWNPAVERQAEDRIYRIGQNENVIIYRLIVKNTVEEKIEMLKKTKDEVGNLLLSNVKELSELDPEIILDIFE